MNKLQGKIGAATFTNSPYGPIVKETVTDAQQPNSPAQQAVKGRFRQVAASWNALDPSQRLDWNAAVAKMRQEGDARKVSRQNGWHLYSSLTNVWYAAHGNVGTPPANPPATEYKGPAVTVSASASANTLTFQASGPVAPGTLLECWIQPLKSISRKPAKGGYRVRGYGDLSGADHACSFLVPAGVYAAGYAFVDGASGGRTSFVAIPVDGVALSVERGGADEKPSARKKAA